MRLGFLGLPIGRSRGPRKEISWKVTKDVMQLEQFGWSSGSKVFPGSCLMLLNVIKSMGCSRELTERNWKSNRRSCIVNTYICMHRCKINQHTLPGSTIPRNMLPLLSLRVESIWFAIDLEDDSSSADAYHVMTSVFEVGGKRAEASQFI